MEEMLLNSKTLALNTSYSDTTEIYILQWFVIDVQVDTKSHNTSMFCKFTARFDGTTNKFCNQILVANLVSFFGCSKQS